MKQIWKRVIAATLAFVMAFSLAISPLGERAIAADYDGVSADTHTMYYPWVQIRENGEWVWSGKNVYHTLKVNGEEIPVYCVESGKRSPQTDSIHYSNISTTSMNFTTNTLNGLRTIVRNGYPYHTSSVAGVSLQTSSNRNRIE